MEGKGREGSDETLSRIRPSTKGACPLCLHSSNKALYSAFSHFRHTLFTHTPSSPSLSHLCSSRSLDPCCCCYSRFLGNGAHCSRRYHPRRCSQLLGRGQHVAEVPCPRGAQGQEGRPARGPRCFHSHLQVPLSLFGGYLGGLVWEGRVFSWVVVAWSGDLKEILDFVYFWSSSSNVEECGFSWVLDVFLGAMCLRCFPKPVLRATL
jgi:hypothetical protein